MCLDILDASRVMPTTTEIVACVAALASAIGTIFSAAAAMRSADSARQAHLELQKNERRTRIVSLLAIATDLEVERERLANSVDKLTLAYSALFSLSGRTGGEQQYIEKNQGQMNAALERAENARLKETQFEAYLESSDDDILKAEAKARLSLAEIRSRREQADADLKEVEIQIAEIRVKRL
jgi:hypothetical protein